VLGCQRSEVCRKDPGFEVELFVQAEPGALARALPTWNRRSPAARATHTAVASTSG
jgi:hypothetical protein